MDYDILISKHCFDEIIEELKKLQSENAELRARLDNVVELPCKIGDKVYW